MLHMTRRMKNSKEDLKADICNDVRHCNIQIMNADITIITSHNNWAVANLNIFATQIYNWGWSSITFKTPTSLRIKCRCAKSFSRCFYNADMD